MCYLYDTIDGMKKQRATTTIRLDEQDKQMIAWIKEHYGVKADNEAIRIALRETVRAIHQQSQPISPPKGRPIHPPDESGGFLGR